MDKKKLEKDFFIIVDKELNIEEIVPYREELSEFAKQSVVSLFPDKKLINEFIKRVNQDGVLCKFLINLHFGGREFACHLNGYKNNEDYYIFVLFNGNENEDVIRAILQLNSEQVNELRVLKKKLNKLDSNQIYEEISKLNSELLNSKRIIEKQNSELKKYNNLLKRMAIEDTLTGCFNRRHFYEYLQENIIPSQNSEIMSIIMIDFNDFKRVNDEFGHDAGDRLLVLFVQKVKSLLVGKGDIYRFGGDEFVILCSLDKTEALKLAEEISESFLDLSSIVTIAYGIIDFNIEDLNNDFDLTAILKKADDLMYQNKKEYKTTIAKR